MPFKVRYYQLFECGRSCTLDNTYTEKEDKRYASTINTYASTNGRYTYSNETFRQKYADIMVNFVNSLLKSIMLRSMQELLSKNMIQKDVIWRAVAISTE